MEFLVHFKITFPPGTPAQVIANLYEAEAKAAQALLDSGHFRRVWREVGTRNHWALWLAPDADHIHEAYSSFPIWQGGYGVVDQVIPLAHNFNDPGPNRISATGDWPDLQSGEGTAHGKEQS